MTSVQYKMVRYSYLSGFQVIPAHNSFQTPHLGNAITLFLVLSTDSHTRTQDNNPLHLKICFCFSPGSTLNYVFRLKYLQAKLFA